MQLEKSQAKTFKLQKRCPESSGFLEQFKIHFFDQINPIWENWMNR